MADKLVWSTNMTRNYLLDLPDREEVVKELVARGYDANMLSQLDDEGLEKLIYDDDTLFDSDARDYEDNIVPMINDQTAAGWVITTDGNLVATMYSDTLVNHGDAGDDEETIYDDGNGLVLEDANGKRFELYAVPEDDAEFMQFAEQCMPGYLEDRREYADEMAETEEDFVDFVCGDVDEDALDEWVDPQTLKQYGKRLQNTLNLGESCGSKSLNEEDGDFGSHRMSNDFLSIDDEADDEPDIWWRKVSAEHENPAVKKFLDWFDRQATDEEQEKIFDICAQNLNLKDGDTFNVADSFDKLPKNVQKKLLNMAHINESLTEGADTKILSQVRRDIEKAKNKLKGKSPRENFGEKEVRALRDKYSDYQYGVNHQVFDLINQFDDWCGSYVGESLSEDLEEKPLKEHWSDYLSALEDKVSALYDSNRRFQRSLDNWFSVNYPDGDKVFWSLSYEELERMLDDIGYSYIYQDFNKDELMGESLNEASRAKKFDPNGERFTSDQSLVAPEQATKEHNSKNYFDYGAPAYNVDPASVKKVDNIITQMEEEDFDLFNDNAFEAYIDKDPEAQKVVNELFKKYKLPKWALMAWMEDWGTELLKNESLSESKITKHYICDDCGYECDLTDDEFDGMCPNCHEHHGFYSSDDIVECSNQPIKEAVVRKPEVLNNLAMEVESLKANYEDFGPEGFYAVPFDRFAQEYPVFTKEIIRTFLKEMGIIPFAEFDKTDEYKEYWQTGELIYPDDWPTLFEGADLMPNLAKGDTVQWEKIYEHNYKDFDESLTEALSFEKFEKVLTSPNIKADIPDMEFSDRLGDIFYDELKRCNKKAFKLYDDGYIDSYVEVYDDLDAEGKQKVTDFIVKHVIIPKNECLTETLSEEEIYNRIVNYLKRGLVYEQIIDKFIDYDEGYIQKIYDKAFNALYPGD